MTVQIRNSHPEIASVRQPRTEISIEAQALIDRLARMDPANPHYDKPAIERAITAHLAALELPERPFVWADDARTGCQIVVERAWSVWSVGEKSTQKDAVGTAMDAAWAQARKAAQFAAHHAAKRAFIASARPAAWKGVGENRWRSAWKDVRSAFKGDNWGLAFDTTMHSASDAAKVGAWIDVRVAAMGAGLAEAMNASKAVVSDAVICATPVAWDATRTPGHVNLSLASNVLATARLASIERPMLDAFEAGLSLYWITPDDVICVLQPRLWLAGGRLHRQDGPAVSWLSGEAYHFWRGVQLPAWVIDEKHRITVDAIRSEPNQEIRRCMAEIYDSS